MQNSMRLRLTRLAVPAKHLRLSSGPTAGKLLAMWLLCVFSSVAPAAQTERIPEGDSGLGAVKSAHFSKALVVTANQHASDVARQILARGGSALDAAIAAQMVLGLVEPQSSGIGGGAFLLYWDNSKHTLHYYDGRETAPAAVDEQYFLNANKEPMKFFDAVIGGHAVGTPGVLRMLEMAHQQYGALDWKELFTPAIRLAEQGFTVSPRLNSLLGWLQQLPGELGNDAFRKLYFDAHGKPLAVGTRLQNTAYANSLRNIATQGTKVFYDGELARAIVSEVGHNPLRPGALSLADLAAYQARERQAVCKKVFSYRVCSAAPPSSGGLTLLMILSLLEHQGIDKVDANSSEFIHLFAQASQLAFADRNAYIADPDFVSTPQFALLEDDYLLGRAQLITRGKLGDAVMPGTPGTRQQSQHWIAADSPELPSTSHLSIVDQQGNVVSMTTSIEMAFGSRLMVGGFLLNNQLTDFSFSPRDSQGKQVANRIEAGKRPRSSMSPSIVFNQDNEPVMVIGSPGGARIIDYVAQTLALVLAKQQSLDEAISAAHYVELNKGLELEADRGLEKYQQQLETLGHQIRFKAQTSGLHGILRERDGSWLGVADPRREGTVTGF